MSMSNTEKTVKDIRRNTRRKFSTEEKIRIVLDGLRGESSVAELCRQVLENTFHPLGRLEIVDVKRHVFLVNELLKC